MFLTGVYLVIVVIKKLSKFHWISTFLEHRLYVEWEITGWLLMTNSEGYKGSGHSLAYGTVLAFVWMDWRNFSEALGSNSNLRPATYETRVLTTTLQKLDKYPKSKKKKSYFWNVTSFLHTRLYICLKLTWLRSSPSSLEPQGSKTAELWSQPLTHPLLRIRIHVTLPSYPYMYGTWGKRLVIITFGFTSYIGSQEIEPYGITIRNSKHESWKKGKYSSKCM
jgi:hypothetical protein